MSRLTPFFGAALIALGTGIAQAHDVAGAQAAVPISGAAAPVYEYVQQATAMAYDGTNMTLQGIAPSTVFFSDRPYRLSGQVPNETFVNLWNAPDGTFAGDPPNAAVTVLSETDLPPVIVELTSAKVDGASLQYGVKVISGELPDNASNVAVFIDHGSGFGGGGMPGGGGFHGGGGGMPGGGFHGGGSFHGGGGLHGGGGFHGGGGGIPGGGGFHGGGDSMPGGGHFHHGGFHGGGHANSDYHGGGTHPHNHHQHHDHHHHSQTGANNGPYCDHAPQDPQCHNFNPYPPSPPPYAYGPDYPYGPQGPYVPYDPAAAAATGATAGAAAADPDDRRTYKYPIPAGPIPKHCHININHTRMICTVPQN